MLDPKVYGLLGKFARIADKQTELTNRHKRDINLTRLWNWADHQNDSELYWEVLTYVAPYFFDDIWDVNSARFTYHTITL